MAKARAIADDYVRPLAQKYDKLQQYNEEATRIAAEEGLFRVFIPDEYGGQDSSILSLCMVVEELAREFEIGRERSLEERSVAKDDESDAVALALGEEVTEHFFYSAEAIHFFTGGVGKILLLH